MTSTMTKSTVYVPAPILDRADLFAQCDWQRENEPKVEISTTRTEGFPQDGDHVDSEYGKGDRYDSYTGTISYGDAVVDLTVDQVKSIRLRAEMLIAREMKSEAMPKSAKKRATWDRERSYPQYRGDINTPAWLTWNEQTGWFLDAVPNGCIPITQVQVDALKIEADYDRMVAASYPQK